MSKKLLSGASCAFCLVVCSTGYAANFSFSGTFSADNDVQLFDFTTVRSSTVTFQSFGYGGGTQADGNVVAAGGFDPILAVFDSNGNLIAENDDDLTGTVTPDPNTGEAWDALLQLALAAGDYTVSIMQYNNFATGPTLGDGFDRGGEPFFTASLDGFGGCSNGQFCDVSLLDPYNNRTGQWAFDILNVEETTLVPVPAAAWLFGPGLLGLAAIARRRKARAA